MNTHVHADHVTGTGILKTNLPGVKSVISKASGSKADMFLEPGDRVSIGDLYLEGGSSDQLYDSVHSQIFTLPKDTLIYPAHDYKGFAVSTVGEEMQHNPRLTKDKETFKTIVSIRSPCRFSMEVNLILYYTFTKVNMMIITRRNAIIVEICRRVWPRLS